MARIPYRGGRGGGRRGGNDGAGHRLNHEETAAGRNSSGQGRGRGRGRRLPAVAACDDDDDDDVIIRRGIPNDPQPQRGSCPPPPNQPCLLTEEEILSLGLKLVGFHQDFRQGVCNDLKQRRFRAFFGIGPTALAELFADLSKIMPDIDAAKLLMTINWLKLYDTEHVMTGRWGFREETVRNLTRKYIETIHQLMPTKVRWGGFEDEEVFIISVDGVHCRVQEVRTDPGAKWYSHKFNAAAVSYELGIAIRSNRLVWVNGPFPASRHDVATFRSGENPDSGLKAMIPDGKRAIGDSGYKGEPAKVAITRSGDSREVKKFKGRVKSRHETFNARLKSFTVLDVAFRHGFAQHKKVFETVCICIQYDIENGNGLFEV
jgi:hypothetical protein